MLGYSRPDETISQAVISADYQTPRQLKLALPW